MIKISRPTTPKISSTLSPATEQGRGQEEVLQSARLPQGTTAQYPTEYDGVAYAPIIQAWLQKKGIFGDVAEGARNNMFYQLAIELRYICNFNRDWLLQVMPTWGLPEAERKSVIDHAVNRPQGRNMPPTLLEAIEQVKQIGGANDFDGQGISNELRNPLPTRLPYVFDLIKKRFPYNPHALIQAALPPLGALCSGIHSDYIDGEEESPIFYCILTGPQASGKRVARKLDTLLTRPITLSDEAQREELREFKKKQRKAKNEKASKQPEEPEVHIRRVPLNVSKRVFLERCFYAEGRSLYSFGEEIDTLSKGMKGGAWADLTDILRLSFDGGEFGQDYAAETSFNAVVQARWNILMCGTWGAVERFFPNVEDGTMTRFMFAQIEDNVGKPLLPRAKGKQDSIEQDILTEAQRLYDMGSTGPIQHIDLRTYTQKALLRWQDVQLQIFKMGGEQDTALDTFRRRSMLMGHRAAIVAAATEGLKDSRIVANFAVWVAQEVLDMQLALYGQEVNNVNKREKQMKRSADGQLRKNSSLRILQEMDDTFTMDELKEEYEARGFKAAAADTSISRWKTKGLVKSEDNINFEKVK